MKTVSLILLTAMAASSQAWDANGHRLVAEIAHTQLKGKALEEVNRLLAKNKYQYKNIGWAAYLADIYKHDRINTNNDWDEWHYVNYSVSNREFLTNFPNEVRPESVIYAIQECRKKIKGEATSAYPDKLTAFNLLLHWVGDIHQPLHVGDRNDGGGNGFSLSHLSGAKHLHALWDGCATWNLKLNRASVEEIQLAVKTIKQRYPEGSFGSKASDLTVHNWAKESYEAAVYYCYSGARRSNSQSDEYLERWEKQGLKRIALAGYRLAHLLEELYG